MGQHEAIKRHYDPVAKASELRAKVRLWYEDIGRDEVISSWVDDTYVQDKSLVTIIEAKLDKYFIHEGILDDTMLQDVDMSEWDNFLRRVKYLLLEWMMAELTKDIQELEI